MLIKIRGKILVRAAMRNQGEVRERGRSNDGRGSGSKRREGKGREGSEGGGVGGESYHETGDCN